MSDKTFINGSSIWVIQASSARNNLQYNDVWGFSVKTEWIQSAQEWSEIVDGAVVLVLICGESEEDT
jgi:hypothetical protein